MNNIGKVCVFELKTQLKKKSFRISILIMVLIVALATSLPNIGNIFDSSKNAGQNEAGSVIEEGKDKGSADLNNKAKYYIDESIDEKVLKTLYPFSKMEKSRSEEELRSEVKDEKIDQGIIIKGKAISILVKNESFSGVEKGQYEEGFKDYLNRKTLSQKGIDPSVLEEIKANEVSARVESIGKSSKQNFLVGYIGIFLIYFMVIMFGQAVATSVANEKSTKTMEILITTTDSTSLVVGKVLAGFIMALMQIIILLTTLMVGLKLNMGSYSEGIVKLITQNMTPGLLLVFLSFTLIGFIMYLFVYAASGSLVSKIEELPSAMGPVTTIVVLAFMGGMSSLYMDQGDIFAKIISFFPLTSPFSMFSRYALSGVPIQEVLISLAILIVSTILLAKVCIKLYRRGTLNYGNKMNIFEGIKSLLKKDK